jgi:putative Holliday junction resolvase
MRILGLDLGTKTLGIALSDPSGIIAFGIETYRFSEGDLAKAITYVLEIIPKNHVEQIVLGYPKNMDSTIGSQARLSEEFKSLLEEKSSVPVFLWDERLTTRSAHRVMTETNTRKQQKKAKVDQIAATFILQSYLDSRK